MLGDHMITVSTDEGRGRRRRRKGHRRFVTLTVSVAGPPARLHDQRPRFNIDLGGRATFTVTAMDANDGVPHFTMDMDERRRPNDTVEIVVPDIAEQPGARVRIASNGVLTLDKDTGMGSFTIYAPSNAPDGSTARIFVSAGDVEITHTVMFGMAPSMAPGMPMNVMAEATSHDMITVSWDAVMDATSYMVQRGYMDADDMMSDWMDVDPAHMGMDMMYMDMGLMAETTYYYRVSATNSVGMGDYSDGMAMATTMVTVSATPPETTAPMGADHSVLGNSISVTWDPNSAQNTTLIKVALFNEGVTALAGIDAPVMAFNLEAATGDPGVHTFNNVPTGTYKVVVAAVDSEGMHIVSVVADPVEIN